MTIISLATPATSTEPYMLAVFFLGVTALNTLGPFACIAGVLGSG